MAWSNVGFDGTITEIEWSRLSSNLGNGYIAAGNGDCLVTAVAGARSVSVAAGSLYGDGVLSTNSAPETVAMTTPVNGQWYVIALRRTWATNTAALVAIAGATTTTTTPTAPPSSFPTLNTNVGVLTDQPIAWAWCNSANTTVVVFDIRLKAVKSMPPVVANANERDAKFMSPWQGLQVWRDDLGAVETYYGLYNASTNPGGRDTAGWYTDDRQTGLVPIRPTTVTIASGSGSANAIGQITAVGATSVKLDNVFSSKYQNYRLLITLYQSDNTGIYTRFSYGATIIATNYYTGQGRAAGNVFDNYSMSNGASVPLALGSGAGTTEISMDIFRPNENTLTGFTVMGSGIASGYGCTLFGGGNQQNSYQFDGLYIFPASGTITASIQVFGYND